jgi:hypothetical protein
MDIEVTVEPAYHQFSPCIIALSFLALRISLILSARDVITAFPFPNYDIYPG